MEHKGIGTLHRSRQDLGDFSRLEKTRKKGGAELNWALLGIKNTSCLSRRSCSYPAAWIVVKEQHLKLGHWGASPGGTNHCWAMARLTVKLVSGPDLQRQPTGPRLPWFVTCELTKAQRLWDPQYKSSVLDFLPSYLCLVPSLKSCF